MKPPNYKFPTSTAAWEPWDRKKAEESLQHNVKNRGRHSAKEEFYGALMARGLWTPNTSAVGIARDGTIINGQGRLHAIVRADDETPGIVVYLLTIRDMDFDESFPNEDRGDPRNLEDIVEIMGLSHPMERSAILAVVGLWERGEMGWRHTLPRTAPTVLMDLAERHDVGGAAAWLAHRKTAGTGGGGRLPCPAFMAFLYHATMRTNPMVAGPFWESVYSGAGLRENDAAFKLRNRLIDIKSDKRNKVSRRYLFAIAIKAWNYEATNTLCDRLTFDLHKEKFPEIHGYPQPRRTEKPERPTKADAQPKARKSRPTK